MARQFGNDEETQQRLREELAQEEAESNRFKNRIVLGISGIFLFFGVICLLSGIWNMIKFNNMKAETREQLAEAQKELDSMRTDEGVMDVKTVELEAVHGNAGAAGKDVCNIQNDLIAMTAQEKQTGGQVSAAHKSALDKLKEYFPAELSNQDGMWRTWCDAGTWTFDCDYEFGGTTMDVVWNCESDVPGRPYAFVTAEYNASTGKFANSRIYKTSWYDSLQQSEQLYVEPDQGAGESADLSVDVLPDGTVMQ